MSAEQPLNPETPEALQAELARLHSALGAAESAARRQYDMLDALFVRSPAAISVNRASDGCFVDVNRHWEQVTGYSWQDAVGHTSLELGFWPSQETSDAAFARLMVPDSSHRPEVPFTTKYGRKVLLVMNGTRIDIAGEPHVAVYLNDITLQREAEAAVAEGERALQLVNEDLRSQLELFELTEDLAHVGHWTVAQGHLPVWSKGLYALSRTPVQDHVSLFVTTVSLKQARFEAPVTVNETSTHSISRSASQ